MWLNWRELCGGKRRCAEICRGVRSSVGGVRWCAVVCRGVLRCAEHNLVEMGEMEEVCGGVRRVEEKCWRCEVGGVRLEV